MELLGNTDTLFVWTSSVILLLLLLVSLASLLWVAQSQDSDLDK